MRLRTEWGLAAWLVLHSCGLCTRSKRVTMYLSYLMIWYLIHNPMGEGLREWERWQRQLISLLYCPPTHKVQEESPADQLIVGEGNWWGKLKAKCKQNTSGQDWPHRASIDETTHAYTGSWGWWWIDMSQLKKRLNCQCDLSFDPNCIWCIGVTVNWIEILASSPMAMMRIMIISNHDNSNSSCSKLCKLACCELAALEFVGHWSLAPTTWHSILPHGWMNVYVIWISWIMIKWSLWRTHKQ